MIEKHNNSRTTVPQQPSEGTRLWNVPITAVQYQPIKTKPNALKSDMNQVDLITYKSQQYVLESLRLIINVTSSWGKQQYFITQA